MRLEHLKCPPCGDCANLRYENGFLCDMVYAAYMHHTETENYLDGPLASFLGWLVHREDIPDCPAHVERTAPLEFWQTVRREMRG